MTRLSRAVAALLPFVFLLSFCSPAREDAARAEKIRRIISLSPSITRQIVDLGSASLLAGVTSYDDYRAPGITMVGTLIQPNLETIIALRPDVVLYSGEDGPVQSVERLRDAGVPLRRFDRNRNFSDICRSYVALGDLLGKGRTARHKAAGYERTLLRAAPERPAAGGPRPRVAFYLSYRPLIAVSSGSFIGRIIADAGGECAYREAGRPYPMVSIESLADADPDVVIVMAGEDPGPFFRELADGFRDLKAVAAGRVYPIPADSIPYYTPADYVKSVERVAGMLALKNH
ncbi:MAG TPA: helical backbone metal receptor [Spirochaetota bacterium]|nr:ABC transporter substrate-binding protein [Spirochaetota bacterium]HOD14299.1 helical backbone metal receptor [Spirochaetota bacterium]HPN13659.1 helical backbone metal receptor [Spirochaetota bacterium]